MTVSQTTYPHASRWQVSIVFMLAFVVFIGLRWQPEAWIESQLQQQAKQHGTTLTFNHLQLHGFTLQAEQVSIQTVQSPIPIILNTLQISPDWSSLFGGNIGAEIHAQWQAQDIQATIIKRTDNKRADNKQTDQIILQDILANIDATKLQDVLDKSMPLPLKIYGQLQLSGAIAFDVNARPLQGKINLLWNTAGIDFSASRIALGNYKLVLQSAQAKDQVNNQTGALWQWNIDGGNALMLAGKGNIDTSAQYPQAWRLNGLIRIEASHKATSLASLLGNKANEFRLSGSIIHPQMQPF